MEEELCGFYGSDGEDNTDLDTLFTADQSEGGLFGIFASPFKNHMR